MVNPLARRSGAEGGAEGGECVQNKRNVVLGSEHGVIPPPLPPSDSLILFSLQPDKWLARSDHIGSASCPK